MGVGVSSVGGADFVCIGVALEESGAALELPGVFVGDAIGVVVGSDVSDGITIGVGLGIGFMPSVGDGVGIGATVEAAIFLPGR